MRFLLVESIEIYQSISCVSMINKTLVFSSEKTSTSFSTTTTCSSVNKTSVINEVSLEENRRFKYSIIMMIEYLKEEEEEFLHAELVDLMSVMTIESMFIFCLREDFRFLLVLGE